MLQITTPFIEFYDEDNEEFVTVEAQTLTLEHSLVSLSKWESKWRKPFLSKEKMTVEESLDYIRCMTLNEGVPPEAYLTISDSTIKKISDYIADPMTATWFSNDGRKGKKGNNRPVTAEVIYHWMIALQIPSEYDKWHLNRLLTLIRVCDEENQSANGKKKRTTNILDDYAALNNARKQKLKTRG